jgi:hypothetical protein
MMMALKFRILDIIDCSFEILYFCILSVSLDIGGVSDLFVVFPFRW